MDNKQVQRLLKSYIYNPKVKLYPKIQEAENYAKEKELGIWKNGV